MSTTPLESFADSVRTEIAAQQEQWSTLFKKGIDGSMDLLDLNMQAARDSMESFAGASERLFAAQSPQEIIAIDSDQLRKEWNRMLVYGGELSSVASAYQSEIGLATQNQFNNCCSMATRLFSESVNTAPKNSNDPFEIFKSAMDNMKQQFDNWTNVASQAVGPNGHSIPIESSDQSAQKKKAGKADNAAQDRA